jgi:hypothetical protein
VSTNAADNSLLPPHGIDQIIATFGDIFEYILPDHSLDPRWQSDFLARADLPFALTLAWDKRQLANKITCHKLLAGTLTDVFSRIQSGGLQSKITSFGGCFSFRPQRTGARLSAHAWGIAVDLNPETNAQGAAGDMDIQIVSVFSRGRVHLGRGLGGQSVRSHALSVLYRILRRTL